MTLFLLLVGCTSILEFNEGDEIAGGDWSLGRGIKPYTNPVVSIAYSPDADKLATAHYPINRQSYRGSSYIPRGGVLRVWDLPSLGPGANLSALLIKDLSLQPIYFDSAGEQVFFIGIEQIIAWNIAETRLEHQTIKHIGNPWAVSPDGRWTVIHNDSKHRLVVVDVQTESVRAEFTLENESQRPAGFSSDGRLLAALVGEDVVIWNLDEQKMQCRFAIPGTIEWFVAFSNSTRQLVTVARGGDQISINNLTDGSLAARWPINNDQVRGFAVSPDGRWIALCGESGELHDHGWIKVWELATGKLATEIEDSSSGWGVTAVAFSPDSRTLASGNANGEIKFWSVPQPE